ncbi:hypothetical protein EMIHUDRAFT_450832 [Emiliania huxleyi CCMP1516]|uniref:Threonine synthase n=2 Tax=Emiliania huxleyi TaxID=2903 RepID=A0A0D3JE44_EMIH1|nr:hypothetical protein EMIHUDRAFT_450832 [Emiliania huxleyi CCMP1516]EOD21779.1 hypothetical protein EMIHUDRAFT_450832 [Emiliania huxleyi CCMP1516]|eukprot:XP_005774208.1 hypothetical protein EMIHUDRAFT_450832 [Emiliania huxleyi CCMP1516]
MPSRVRYQSTRGGVHGLDFSDILLSAYAPDGGLFVPELSTMPNHIAGLHPGMTLAQVTARVLEPFTGIALADCEEICAAAFLSFNNGLEPALPLVRAGRRLLLETGAGPTLAFKDIGQQVVARLLNHVLGGRGERATIVVETSGDTGPAAIEAVRGCEAVRIFCLYPEGRVSRVQELQMVTVDSPNVFVYRTEGDTDEQAEALKRVFEDAAFMRRHSVCSINSINWARVLVQAGYYLWACQQVSPASDRPVHFVVPTGAFGNAAGGLLAKRLGGAVGRIVCATNSNDVVHRTISRGDMSMRANQQTVSPAMDIQFAYNVERLLYFCSGGDATAVAALMATLEADRAVALPPPLLHAVQDTFVSCAVSDAQTLQTMREVWAADGYALDPHSAIGVHALRTTPRTEPTLWIRYSGGMGLGVHALDHVESVRAACEGGRVVCVLTAHPAKFEEAVAAAGLPAAVCNDPRVAALERKPKKFRRLRDPKAASRQLKLEAWASEGRVSVPPIQTLGQPPLGRFSGDSKGDGQACIKSAYEEGGEVFVAKVASGGGGNNSGLVLVFSQRTFAPLAVLLDGGLLTELRTAAAGALAASLFAPAEPHHIAVIGCGVQARYQLGMLAAVTPCRAVRLWSRRPEQARALAAELDGGPAGWAAEVAPSAEAACRGAGIVLTVTPARSAIVRTAWLRRPVVVLAIGADSAGKQELEAGALIEADLVVVDSRAQCVDKGELQHAVAAGFDPEEARELGECIAEGGWGRGSKPSRPELVVFDSTGVAIQDVKIAELCLAELSRQPAVPSKL